MALANEEYKAKLRQRNVSHGSQDPVSPSYLHSQTIEHIEEDTDSVPENTQQVTNRQTFVDP